MDPCSLRESGRQSRPSEEAGYDREYDRGRNSGLSDSYRHEPDLGDKYPHDNPQDRRANARGEEVEDYIPGPEGAVTRRWNQSFVRGCFARVDFGH